MEDIYYSERKLGFPPQDDEEIKQQFWGGFVSLINRYIDNGFLAEHFPLLCDEYPVPIGCDRNAIKLAFKAEFASVEWPLDSSIPPNTLLVLDAVQYFYKYISIPKETIPHSFLKHNHLLSFDKYAGQEEYLNIINRLFRRNNLAYDLRRDGEIVRLGPAVLREQLTSVIFHSEDGELNRLLEVAREKFFNPDVNIRREAVEKLWDAWERLKTIEPGKDKKEQTENLLKKAITQNEFHDCVEQEAITLTKLGNKFAIRHTETNKIIISESDYLDYLFHRLFALILMLLRRTKRGG